VDEALALRRWALGALARGPRPAAPPPPASPAGWTVFLMGERCALGVADALGRGRMADPVLRVLARRAHVEAQRVLGVRAQLAGIAGAAGRLGLRVVALKGAVPLLRGAHGPDLLDLDVWASPRDAAALAAWLDAAGLAPEGADAAHRLAVRAAPDTMPVEIHTSIPGLDACGPDSPRLRPLGALWALPAVDQAWHLLLHATEQHPDRRGRLRELLLLRDALDECSPGEVADLAARARTRAYPAMVSAQLELAMALGTAAGPAADPFALTAATQYVLVAAQRRLPDWLLRPLWRAAAAAAARRQGAPSEIGGGTLHLPSRNPVLAFLRRIAPAAEQGTRRLVRRAPEWAFAPGGWLVTARASRAVDRARRAG
jgi:hypothetical protein